MSLITDFSVFYKLCVFAALSLFIHSSVFFHIFHWRPWPQTSRCWFSYPPLHMAANSSWARWWQPPDETNRITLSAKKQRQNSKTIKSSPLHALPSAALRKTIHRNYEQNLWQTAAPVETNNHCTEGSYCTQFASCFSKACWDVKGPSKGNTSSTRPHQQVEFSFTPRRIIAALMGACKVPISAVIFVCSMTRAFPCCLR